MNRPRAWWVVLAVLLVVLAVWYRHFVPTLAVAGVPVAGGDGGGLPRADASAEGFEVSGLQEAVTLAAQTPASALLLLRHGHLLLEQYHGHAAADTLVDGGELSAAVLTLATDIAVVKQGLIISAAERPDATRVEAAIAAASGMSYPSFLSHYLWQPLNAAPGRVLPDGSLQARAGDWLRVAELLLQSGRFEGTQIVPAGAVAGLLKPRPAAGAEPLAASEVYFLRGAGATHLWLLPRFELAILYVAMQPPGVAADETRLPNMVIRALRDRQLPTGRSLNDLVPGH